MSAFPLSATSMLMACRSLNLYSAHGPVVNPFGLEGKELVAEQRSAGGSSGGSAAAVAVDLCDAYVLLKPSLIYALTLHEG